MPTTDLDFLHALLRAQFGLSASFHFLFVPLSLGLLLCINLLRTHHLLAGQAPADETAARFWTRFFVLSWLVGVATGYPLRWQLQENWGAYTQAASPVLKAIFAIEGVIAPLMLALLLAVVWGRRWLGLRVHTLAGWLLLAAMLVQSSTILAINAWMQHPVGVSFEATGWRLNSLSELLLNDTAIDKFLHTVSAAMLCGAMFVLFTALGHIAQGVHRACAAASVRTAAWVGLLAVGAVLASGHESALGVAQHQPKKFAAFEAHWRAEPGPAGLVLFALPDAQARRNRFELKVPYLLSLMSSATFESPPGLDDLDAQDQACVAAALDATPQGLARHPHHRAWQAMAHSVAARDPQAWAAMSRSQQAQAVARAATPPVPALFGAFHVMVASGLALLALFALVFLKREALAQGRAPKLARLARACLPLPWVAILSGWAVAEVGRQPWAVFERMPTATAALLPTWVDAFTGATGLCLGGVVVAATFVQVARSIHALGPECPSWWRAQGLSRWGGQALRQARGPGQRRAQWPKEA